MKRYNILVVNLKTPKGAFGLLKEITDKSLHFFLITKKADVIDEYRSFFKKIITINSSYSEEFDGLAKKVKELNRKHPLDGLLCLTDEAIFYGAILNKMLGKKGPLPENTIIVKNKFILRDTLAKKGLFNHFYQLINSQEDILKISDRHFPLIAKPLTAASSISVEKIQSPKELLKYYDKFKKNNPNQLADELSKRYLSPQYHRYDLYNSFMVEEYLRGSEVSIEGLVVDKKIFFIGITDKIVTPPPYFIEMGHTFPSQRPAKLQKKILDFTAKCLKAAKVDNTGFHVEMKIRQNQLEIVEINGRLGGDFIQNLIYYTKGYNTILGLIDVSLGRFKGFKKINKDTDKIASIRYLIAPEEGTLKSLQFQKAVKKFQKNIRLFSLDKEIGQKILLPPKDFTSLRLGWVIFSASSLKELQQASECFKKEVKIIIS
jgi:biotin carboxylase